VDGIDAAAVPGFGLDPMLSGDNATVRCTGTTPGVPDLPAERETLAELREHFSVNELVTDGSSAASEACTCASASRRLLAT
jgi:hypothetical protein